MGREWTRRSIEELVDATVREMIKNGEIGPTPTPTPQHVSVEIPVEQNNYSINYSMIITTDNEEHSSYSGILPYNSKITTGSPAVTGINRKIMAVDYIARFSKSPYSISPSSYITFSGVNGFTITSSAGDVNAASIPSILKTGDITWEPSTKMVRTFICTNANNSGDDKVYVIDNIPQMFFYDRTWYRTVALSNNVVTKRLYDKVIILAGIANTEEEINAYKNILDTIYTAISGTIYGVDHVVSTAILSDETALAIGKKYNSHVTTVQHITI